MAAQLKTELTLKDKNFSAQLNSACKKALNQLKNVSSASSVLGDKVGGAAGKISGLIGGFSKLAGPAAAATASLAAVTAVIGDIVANSSKFELALDHLQSLLGLTADLMDNVKSQILNTANAIHVGASEVADAYGIVGSKMPELLENVQGLDLVVRAASTLGKAGLMDLETAIESLTSILNQMNLTANDANDVINVLAAGSKNGAGNIQYLAEVFNKAGSAFRTSNMSIEESTAVIEAVAKKTPDAAVAGTRLNKVFITLATQANKDLNPGLAGLETALQNLKKMSGNTTEMVKMFGSANYSTAMILAEEADNIARLTDQVTGTSEAEKQAETNTQNLSGRVAALKASWENLTSAFSESIGVLSTLVGWLDKAIQKFTILIAKRTEFEGIDFDYKKDDAPQKEFLINKFKGQGMSDEKAERKALDYLYKDNKALLEIEQEKLKTRKLDVEALKKQSEIAHKRHKKNIEEHPFSTNKKMKKDYDYMVMIDKLLENAQHNFTLSTKQVEKYAAAVNDYGRELGYITDDNDKPPTPPAPPKIPKGGSGGSGKNEIPALDDSLEYWEKKAQSKMELFKKGLFKGSTDEFWDEYDNIQKIIKNKKLELKLVPDKDSLDGINDELNTYISDLRSGKIIVSAEEAYKTIKDLEDKIEAKEIEKGLKLPPNEIEKLEKQLKTLEENQLNPKLRLDAEEYKKQHKELEQQIESEKIEWGVSLSKDDLDQELKETLDDFRKKSSFELAVGIEPPKSNEDKLSFIQQLMDENDALLEQLKELQKEYEKLGEAGAEGYQQVSAKIAEVNAELTKLGGEAQTTDGVIKQTNKMSTGFSRAGEAVGAFGDIMSSLSFESPELNVAGTIAQAIAQIALGAGNAIAQAAEMGPWAWVAFGLSAMAQLAAMVSQLHSITGYASGGIIGGGKSVGDKNIVAVNSGELILNKPQLARLWRMLNGSESSSISSQSGGQVEFKIRGADLYGSLKNYKTLSKKQ